MFESSLLLPDFKFKIPRNAKREIVQEDLCKQIYPALKKAVDGIWLTHSCEKCQSKAVIMEMMMTPAAVSQGKLLRFYLENLLVNFDKLVARSSPPMFGLFDVDIPILNPT